MDIDVHKRAILCGSPRRGSKTLDAAVKLDHVLFSDSSAPQTVDIADGSPSAGEIARLVEWAELLVVASPVYKGAMTGMLKSVLDVLPSNSLGGTLCVPLMLGGSPAHSLAVRYSLVPTLEELGGFTLPALYVTESELAEGTEWASRYRDHLGAVSDRMIAALTITRTDQPASV